MLRPVDRLNDKQLQQLERFVNSRTEEEVASVRHALDNTMDLWYNG